MRLFEFILGNVEPILVEWEAYARSIWPETLVDIYVDPAILRDHAAQILRTTAADMMCRQTESQRTRKSLGFVSPDKSSSNLNRASALHGAARVTDGFDLGGVVAEYRALRASVLSLWRKSCTAADVNDLDDLTRFNESIDQSLTEAVHSYSELVESKRKLAEAQLLTELVELSPFGVYIVDSDFRIAHMNTSSQKGAFSNVRPVLGRRFDEAIHIIWPEHVAREVIGVFRRTLNTGEPFCSKNFVNTRADKNQVEGYEWELHKLTMPDGRNGVICYFYDSTELRQTEAALREAHGRTVSVLNSMSDAYIEMDEEFRLTFVNTEAARLNGFRAEDVLGKTHWEVWPWCNGTELEWNYRKAMSDKQPCHFEFFYEPRPVWLDVHAYPMTNGLAVYFSDISDSKRVALEREHVLHAERAAREEAERVSRMKDEFLATLSHELRTPLNAILGWSQILKRAGKTDKDYSQGMKVIEQSARAQVNLIDDLLDMSRIISGKIRLDVHRVELGDVVKASIFAVQPAADARGVHLEKFINSFEGSVSGDPARLHQIIWNLLTNAVKFTPKGGKVQVVLKQIGSQAEIQVIDTGKGIKGEFLPFVFDRFRQEDASTTRRFGGLGIGLSIVKNLVESHGGSVSVSSEGEGRGATFSIVFPILTFLDNWSGEDGKDLQREEPFAIEADGTPNLEGIKVLIVDDHTHTRELVRRMLEECQAVVLSASSAAEALDFLESERPHVLVCDIGMPDMDGFELISRVRQLPAECGGETPAAALTAFARSEDRLRALLAGYQSHIAKPFESLELVTVVASLALREWSQPIINRTKTEINSSI